MVSERGVGSVLFPFFPLFFLPVLALFPDLLARSLVRSQQRSRELNDRDR